MRGAMDKHPPTKEEAAAPSMVSQAAAAAASAASGVARTSVGSLQPLLNTATAR